MDAQDSLLLAARTIFTDFLTDGGGKFSGISLEKFYDRGGTFESDPQNPGQWIIGIERHRRIGGAEYTKGSPMSAYETFTQILRFDPEKRSLEDIDEIHLSYDISISNLAAEHLCDSLPRVSRRKGWKLKRRVENITCGYCFEAESIGVARTKLEEEYRAWNLNMIFEGLEIPDDTRDGYISALKDEIINQVFSCLENGWKEPDLIEE